MQLPRRQATCNIKITQTSCIKVLPFISLLSCCPYFPLLYCAVGFGFGTWTWLGSPSRGHHHHHCHGNWASPPRTSCLLQLRHALSHFCITAGALRRCFIITLLRACICDAGGRMNLRKSQAAGCGRECPHRSARARLPPQRINKIAVAFKENLNT